MLNIEDIIKLNREEPKEVTEIRENIINTALLLPPGHTTGHWPVYRLPLAHPINYAWRSKVK